MPVLTDGHLNAFNRLSGPVCHFAYGLEVGVGLAIHADPDAQPSAGRESKQTQNSRR